MPDRVSSDIYDEEIEKSINVLKKFREVWIGKENHRNRDLFMFADPEFYFYRFMIDRVEKQSVELTKQILRRLLDRYSIQTDWCTAEPFDFIAIDICGNRTGFRFIEFYQDEDVRQYASQKKLQRMSIIFFVNESYDATRYFDSRDGLLTPYTLENVFDMLLSHDEYTTFKKKVYVYLRECINIMGYTSIPYLSPMNFAILKSTIASELVSSEIKQPCYNVIDPKALPYKMQDPSNYVIDDDNQRVITKRFIGLELYKALVGSEDFAKSFLTSEWLYMVLKGKEHFDYTAIISGYLKSIEQLLYKIAMLFLTDDGINGFRITMDRNKFNLASKAGIRTYPPKSYPRIDFTRSNLEYMSFELGSLEFFFKENAKSIFEVSESEKIINMIFCFRTECRNGYFHRHNLGQWNIVEKTRSNALCLYRMLLGGCKIELKDFGSLGIEEIDQFDLVCRSIREFSKRSKDFIFEYEVAKKRVVFDMHKNPLTFTENGQEHYDKLSFIAVQDSSVETYELLNKGVEDSQRVILTRNALPKRIWGIGRDGEAHKLL